MGEGGEREVGSGEGAVGRRVREARVPGVATRRSTDCAAASTPGALLPPPFGCETYGMLALLYLGGYKVCCRPLLHPAPTATLCYGLEMELVGPEQLALPGPPARLENGGRWMMGRGHNSLLG